MKNYLVSLENLQLLKRRDISSFEHSSYHPAPETPLFHPGFILAPLKDHLIHTAGPVALKIKGYIFITHYRHTYLSRQMKNTKAKNI